MRSSDPVQLVGCQGGGGEGAWIICFKRPSLTQYIHVAVAQVTYVCPVCLFGKELPLQHGTATPVRISPA